MLTPLDHIDAVVDVGSMDARAQNDGSQVALVQDVGRGDRDSGREEDTVDDVDGAGALEA